MAEITAALVKDLREKSGAGMMDCKKALTETGGDFEKAIDFLRQKGLASAAKKSARAASEGAVTALIEGNAGVVVEINCETDFVAKNDDFRQLSTDVAQQILTHKPANPDELLTQRFEKNKDVTVAQLLTEKVAKIGENIVVRRFQRYEAQDGVVASYIHAGGKIGVLVEFGGKPDKELQADVAMHVAAAAPVAVRREEFPADLLAREREVYKQQAIEQGKKPEIAEKMVVGRIEKYYKESCLLDQPFVKNPDVSVQQRINEKDKSVTVKRFVRFQLGEGIEKKQDDFAAEVAKMAGTK